MGAIPFDTHAFVKRLQGVGFHQDQAEAIVDLQREISATTIEQVKHGYFLDELATKLDLREMESKIEARIAVTNAKIAGIKTDLAYWIIGAGVLQASLVIAIFQLQ